MVHTIVSLANYEEVFNMFPSAEYSTRCSLTRFYILIQKVYFVSLDVEYYTSIFGVFLTLFHLVILTRKAMRTSSVMSTMIGIALCDLVSMIAVISMRGMIENMAVKECTPPNTFLATQTYRVLQAVRDNAIRCSTWLSVSLAVFRYLMIKLASKPTDYNKIFKFVFGFQVFAIVFVISTLLSIAYFLRGRTMQVGEWEPAEHCADQTVGVQPIYDNLVSDLFTLNNGLVLRIFMFVNGTSAKIFPCLILPILSIFIIVAFRKAQNIRRLSNCFLNDDHSSERTTGLVIFMSVSFFLALLPTGIMTCFCSVYTDVGFLFMGSFIEHICYALLTLNAAFHCLFCFTMSSQYRNSVWELFRPVKVRVLGNKSTTNNTLMRI